MNSRRFAFSEAGDSWHGEIAIVLSGISDIDKTISLVIPCGIFADTSADANPTIIILFENSITALYRYLSRTSTDWNCHFT